MDILGIGNMVSSAISSGLNVWQQNKNLEFQKQAYKDQFEYQKELNRLQMEREDSAVQRNVADRTKAGLNPLGAGASQTTALQTATPQAPTQQVDYSQIPNQIMGALQMQENIANTKADRMLTQRQIATEAERANNTRIDTLLKKRQSAKTDAERRNINAQIRKTYKDLDIMNYNLNKSMNMGIRTNDYIDFATQQALRAGKSFMQHLADSMGYAKKTARKRAVNGVGGRIDKSGATQNWQGTGGHYQNGRRYGY